MRGKDMDIRLSQLAEDCRREANSTPDEAVVWNAWSKMIDEFRRVLVQQAMLLVKEKP